MGWLRRLKHGAMDMLFPRGCAACDAALSEENAELCPSCAIKLADDVGGLYCGCCTRDVGPHLLRNGRCTDCQTSQPGYERVVRVGHYGTLRELILRFKYSAKPTLDAMLGDLMVSAVQGGLADVRPSVWVPIPSPRMRTWRRGFQPTRLLADRLAARLGGRRCDSLRLTRRARPQKDLPGDMRTANVRDIFSVRRLAAVRRGAVVLVDDVFTTGATLREAARTLRRAKAGPIYAVVLATARPGHDTRIPRTGPGAA